MNFQLLKFDTKLFGFKVAKILPPRLSSIELQNILGKLREQNVRLVYWPSDSFYKISQKAAKKFNGFLGSKQITYLSDLKKLSQPLDTTEVEIYQKKTTTTELEQLAIQAGAYSRFKIDPRFSEELFLKLYHAWVENSINGSIATDVIIIRHKNKIIGMATLGEKKNRGDIGLLAIDSNFRNKNLGTKLVRAAQAYFIKNKFFHAQVVTQKANIPACRLYEKCGFHQEKAENFYHFWL